MQYTCPICKVAPSSHSLKKIGEKNGVLYYYTCPAQATLYYDVKGILNHYEGVLSEIPENKEWVWVFDSAGFGFTHAMQINVAIELSQLITTFSQNLKKIIIINPTFFITTTHHMLLPFLNQKLKDIIEINYEVKLHKQ